MSEYCWDFYKVPLQRCTNLQFDRALVNSGGKAKQYPGTSWLVPSRLNVSKLKPQISSISYYILRVTVIPSCDPVVLTWEGRSRA